MPWDSSNETDLREEFVREVREGEANVSALCRAYGISRKTGYKWLKRAEQGMSLANESRTPKRITGKTETRMEELIVKSRKEHPSWGPKKLRRWLENKGYEKLPCKNTIAKILKRNGQIDPAESIKHSPWHRYERAEPNDLWQMDFKGDFMLGNGERCYPLTILDDHSRYSLCLQGCNNFRFENFQPIFTRVLEEYGLAKAILCDNGKPWGDSKVCCTVFDVWMMQLGILPIHGKPLHPQTQGKEERFHRTMDVELLNGQIYQDLNHAQPVFDAWRWTYNNERPHEALGLDCPAKHYDPSDRRLPQKLSEPIYDSGMTLCRVNYKGYVSVNRKRYYLSEALVGKFLAIVPLANDFIVLQYGNFEIAKIDLQQVCMVSKHIFLRA